MDDHKLSVIVNDEKCIKVFRYDREGREIPKQWYTFINVGDGIVEASFKVRLTYGVAVALGRSHCEVNGFEYIGTCDVFGLKAMREIATDRLLSG